MKNTIYIFTLTILFSSCLKEESPFAPFQGIEPKDINDGWAIAKPIDENVDEQALTSIFQDIHDQGELFQLRSLLIFRNNKLIAETYFKAENDISTPKPIWSCTKQIVGALTGIAIENGIIDSINAPISSYLSAELQNHPDKENITISDLLTMRAGIGFDETKDVSALLQQKQENVIDFILEKPLLFSPGQEFSYNSGETHLITASIQNGVGQPLEKWADDVLFSKIRFDNYTWLKYDGYNFGGYGISTTPRELAKIAQLVLNEGNWNGEQLIDSLWIKEMVSTQTVTSSGSDYTFGNLWWVNVPEGIFFMSGSGGQYAVIVPDKNLLVVAMSEHDTDGDLEIDFNTFLQIVNRIGETAN